jgi:hypothetical protein
MGMPGNMFINNHQSMGEDLLLHALAIEGEEGYDPRILEEYSRAVLNKLIYDISPSGFLHEKCKGFVPERATVAITKRQKYPLMSLDRIRAMVMAKVMDSNNLFERYLGTYSNNKSFDIGTGNTSPRRWYMGFGSGPWMDQFFNWAFIIKHAYPQDPIIDYFYKLRMENNDMGAPGDPLKENEKLPRIRYTHRDLMILCATDGLKDKTGKVIDYNKTGLPNAVKNLPVLWKDLGRGVAMSRNNWDKDSLMVHYECRSDVYSAGHETPEANDFYIYANGVEWTTRRIWYLDSYFRNMVLIDGYAGIYSPVAGKLMLADDNASGSTFISDATDQYNWRKREKNFYSWHPMLKEADMHMNSFVGGRWGRDWEVPFQEQMRTYHEGYAGLDWGNWHGETRGPEMFERWNDVDHVFRTMHLSKGKKPYALVIDDVRKDDKQHNYDWCMLLSPDIVLYKGDSSVQGRQLQKGMPEQRWTDLHLCTVDVPFKRYQRYSFNCQREAKKGDPMLLVRVLWRNSQFAFPQPSVEQGWGPARVIIPSIAVEPKFRVLIYPYLFGDDMPITSWNKDQTELTVRIGDTSDVYTFNETDRERTVFAKTRNGKSVGATAYGPAAPILDLETGYTQDRNNVDEVRELVFADSNTVSFKSPGLDKNIRYTFDGSEPNIQSALYEQPLVVKQSGLLKAKTFASYWPYRTDNSSETTSLRLVKRAPATAFKQSEYVAGLSCDIYEEFMTIFDNNTGVFTGKKKLIPEFADRELIRSWRVENFRIPPSTPKASAVEMEWGYYRYTGFFEAKKTGVYNFKLNSCGPIDFNLAGQQIILVDSVYGNSQKDRYGSAVLSAGMHSLELIVCDPVYWKNGAEEGAYKIQMKVMKPGENVYTKLSNSLLKCSDGKLALDTAPPVPEGKAVNVSAAITGLSLAKYFSANRPEKMPYEGLKLEDIDPANLGPKYYTENVLTFSVSGTPRALYDFNGYMRIIEPGIYHFETDKIGANRLFIDDIEIMRNKVVAPQLPGIIKLDSGLHKVRLLAADGQGMIQIKSPSSMQFISAPIGMFCVNPIKTTGDGRLVAEIVPEIGENGKMPLKGLYAGAVANAYEAEIVNGRKGKAIKLNGENSRIDLKNLPAPENATSLSVWIRVDESSRVTIMDDHREQEACMAEMNGVKGRAEFWRASERAVFSLNTENKYQMGKDWRHLAITFGDTVCVYVDGKLVSEKSKTVPERSSRTHKKELFRGLIGAVEDVCIYNKVLSAEEVNELSLR